MSDKKFEQLDTILSELSSKNLDLLKEHLESKMNSLLEKKRTRTDSEKFRLGIRLDGSDPQDYFDSFEIIKNWIETCMDEVRNHLIVIIYPLYVYLFLDMIAKKLFSQCHLLTSSGLFTPVQRSLSPFQ